MRGGAAAAALFLLCGPRLTVANYALGDADPMCWKLDTANTPIDCPKGLSIGWVPGMTPPAIVPVNVPIPVAVSINLTFATMTDLAQRSLLSSTNPNVTAADRWALCGQPNTPCTTANQEKCCLWHINAHSCLNAPGVFCGPWVANDGFLATHTPAQTGSVGPTNGTVFTFTLKLFWQGDYMVIVHFKFANMHFAIGRASSVKLVDNLCASPMVPNRTGGCERCHPGAQPVTLGIPRGGSQMSDDDAKKYNANPLCILCPPGWYSPDGSQCLEAQPGYFQNSSNKTEQWPCKPGYSNPLLAMTICLPCGLGQYAGDAAPFCNLCPKGSFGNTTALSACEACPGIRTTDSLGATNISACLCPEGTYAAPGDGDCLPCPTGMSCPFASSYDNFNLWAQGDEQVAIPLLLPGYYSDPSEPISIYLCDPAVSTGGCPGGGPGTCGQGRIGLGCAQCETGQSAKIRSECQRCGETRLAIALLVIAMFAIVVGAYYTANSPPPTRASNMITFSATGSLAVMALQALGIKPKLNIQWPEITLNTMNALSFTLLSTSAVLDIHCVTASPVGAYVLRCIPPVALAAIVVFCFLTSRTAVLFRPSLAWSTDKSINTLGMVLQVFFVGIAVLVSHPFQCYTHPNGKQSLSVFPEVLCGSDEHNSIIGLGLGIGAGFVLPFFTLCVYITIRLHYGNVTPAFMRRFRFYVYRFRPSKAGFNLIVLMRTILLAFAPCISADAPHFQLIYMCITNLMYLVLSCRIWPWVNMEICLFDTAMTGTLCIFELTAMALVPKPHNTEPYGTFLMVLLILLFVVVGLAYIAIFMWTLVRGPKASFGIDSWALELEATDAAVAAVRSLSTNSLGSMEHKSSITGSVASKQVMVSV